MENIQEDIKNSIARMDKLMIELKKIKNQEENNALVEEKHGYCTNIINSLIILIIASLFIYMVLGIWYHLSFPITKYCSL